MRGDEGTDRPFPGVRTVRLLAGAAGLVAALVALGVAELVADLVDAAAAPVVAVGGGVVEASPAWLQRFAVSTLGTNDKPVLLTGIVVVLALLSVGAGVLALRWPAAGVLGVGLLALVGAAAAMARPATGSLAFAPSLLGAVAGAVALRLLLRPLRAAPAGVGQASKAAAGAPDGPATAYDRRAFLVTGVGALAVAAVSGAAGRAALATRFGVAASRDALRLPRPVSPAPPLPADVHPAAPGLGPFVTPNRDFYRIDTALLVPQVSTDEWRLRVHGMVDREIELDFAQLLDRGLVERDITLACVSNEVGGPYVGNARWLGVSLADLLREAGVDPAADQLVSTSVDGMTIGTPTAVVLDGRDALLAVGMNGEPLPATHGFPVRMVVPGLYGYVSATKWVVDLELRRFADVDPFWVQRGWVDRAPVKTMSRIDTPRSGGRLAAGRVAVAGVAWAQHRGIERVEVRVDGGAWQEARLAGVPSVDTWRQWVWSWDAEPGGHVLQVRATDRTGAVQTGRQTEPFPSGATGWHEVEVTVA